MVIQYVFIQNDFRTNAAQIDCWADGEDGQQGQVYDSFLLYPSMLNASPCH